MEEIIMSQIAKTIANGSEIILRETKTTKVVFVPTIINDDSTQGVKGKILFLKKSQKDIWEKHDGLNMNMFKSGEWSSISFSSSEIQRLFDSLVQSQMIVKKYGIESSKYTFYEEREKVQQAIHLIENSDFPIDDLLKSDTNRVIDKVLQWLSNKKDIEKVIDKLDSLEVDNLEKINSVIGLTNLKKIMAIWENNKDREQTERFWQDTLKEHTWILSQIFSIPTIVINDEAYIGGKSPDNKGGRLVDFLLTNPFSNDSVLIEIKTPQEELLSKKEYRNNVYPIKENIVGAVSQVLKYKSTLQQSYRNLVGDHRDQGKEVKFEAINPSCVVIVGKMSSLTSVPQKHSFEYYRKELRSVTLITYDELFEKVQSFIDLLES